jgi:hypothetical protein
MDSVFNPVFKTIVVVPAKTMVNFREKTIIFDSCERRARILDDEPGAAGP